MSIYGVSKLILVGALGIGAAASAYYHPAETATAILSGAAVWGIFHRWGEQRAVHPIQTLTSGPSHKFLPLGPREKPLSDADSFHPSALQKVNKKIRSVIVNRCGLAFYVGKLLVPSQRTCPNAQKSLEIIDRAAEAVAGRIEKFLLPVDQDLLTGLIYYPPDWDRADQSRCVIHHHGNGATLSEYFKTGKLECTPAELSKLTGCPIIMYDYRGTGLSSVDRTGSKVRPTYESIVDDGGKVLRFALEKFKDITIMGSSLGGAVATISLARHLNRQTPSTSPYFAPGRVRLASVGSFTTSTSVFLPKWPKIGPWVGWAIGGFVDAASPMKTLIEQKIPIIVLCHQNDYSIRRGARMAELVSALPPKPNVSVFYSQEEGHSNLSEDMMERLKQWLAVS